LREKSQLLDRLQKSRDSRATYIRAKVATLISAQLHALRLKQRWTQLQFAHQVDMKQSRVSAMEQPGAVNFNLETLIRSAATFGVGLTVKFVSFSEMLSWENNFDQDAFRPARIYEDRAFLMHARAPYGVHDVFSQSSVVWGKHSASGSIKQLPQCTTDSITAFPVDENYGLVSVPAAANKSQSVIP
jgi:transcriptional regulator with XRE-family HTH domain